MVGTIESVVRENDDVSLSAYRSAKNISEEYSFSFNTCVVYLCAKRRGFGSREAYKEFLAIQSGFPSVNKHQHGPSRKIFLAQRTFEKGMEIVSAHKLDLLVSSSEYLKGVGMSEFSDFIYKSIPQLSERLKFVIVERYFSGKTLDNIGKKLGVCRERVSQLEDKALRILQRKAEEEDLLVA